MSIATPEGVEVDLVLAGLGSRFVAALIDGLLQYGALFALNILALFLGGLIADAESEDEVFLVLFAALIVLFFLLQFGYHVLFETWQSGRTPGKRWTGLRVVRTGGAPVDFTASAVRNLLRLVDFLPTLYGVGTIAILATRHNQRLGDLAAGTIVVQERRPVRQLAPPAPAWIPPEAATWDVSTVSIEELGTVRRFLERRPTLTPQARSRLAWELATRLRPKVTGPPEDLDPEAFLDLLAATKAARG